MEQLQYCVVCDLDCVQVLGDQSSWEHVPERQLVSLALKEMQLSFQQMTRSTEMQAHLLLGNCIMTDLRSNKSSSITEFIRRCPMADNKPLLKVDYDRSQPVPHQTAQTGEGNKMPGGLEVQAILFPSQLACNVKALSNERPIQLPTVRIIAP